MRGASRSASRLWLALSLLLVIRTGVWAEGDIEALRNVAVDPLDASRIESAGFRARNWLGPLVAGGLQLDGTLTFFLFHFLLGVLLLVTCYKVVKPALVETDAARGTLLMLAMIPGIALPFFWIGNDAVTLLLLALYVLLRSRTVVALSVGVLLGMNHFEQGIVAIGALALWGMLRSSTRMEGFRSVRPEVWGLIGLGLGRALQGMVFGLLGVAEIESRTSIAIFGREDWSSLKAVYFMSPLVLWSFVGLGILVVLLGTPRDRAAGAVTLGAISVPALIAFDQTRVFLVTSFPVMLMSLQVMNPSPRRWVGRRFWVLVGLWCVTPWVYVESWKIAGSVTPYSVAWLVDYLTSYELSSFPR
jgi:hypothetical protein